MKLLTKTIEAITHWTSLTDSQKQEACLVILDYFGAECRDEPAIAALADALANSGKIYRWPQEIRPLGSVISSGGPSSLSTLLCPFIVASTGCYVPNLTVPGTIAGALDTLELIGNYRTSLSQDEMIKALRASKIANTLTSSEFTPADGYLFSMRKRLSKKAVPALVVASLLAKKLATTNYCCAVDIRCGPLGNLGSDIAECTRNAELLIKVAEKLRIRARCVVTDITQPLMPYLGRYESLQALSLAVSGDQPNPWLYHHMETCTEIAIQSLLAAGVVDREQQARAMVNSSLTGGGVKRTLGLNLVCQGSSVETMEETKETGERRAKRLIVSKESGYVEFVDCGALSMALVRASINYPASGNSIGLRCLKRTGEKVESRETIIELFYAANVPVKLIDNIASDVSFAYRIVSRTEAGLPAQIMDIIS